MPAEMAKDVSVGMILPESDGSIDPNTENWDPDKEYEVVNAIQDGFKDTLQPYDLRRPVSFTIAEERYRVPIGYEPINRPSTDHPLWVSDAMASLGYDQGDNWERVRDYINDLRDSTGSDWAFAIFVVDSENDPDGCFTDDHPVEPWRKMHSFAFAGGPYFVTTYDTGNIQGKTGPAWMDHVTVHETNHIFYATDEYNGKTEYRGYLNVADEEGSGCIMDVVTSPCFSRGTRGQIGWFPLEAELPHPIDTVPDTSLVPYSPDPTPDPTPTYTGSAMDVPYPNSNPTGPGRDVTINTITNVQFRVDEGSWQDASPADGAFDGGLEDFTFTTPSLEPGTHTIETRAINSVGHVETSYACDTITVIEEHVYLQIASMEYPPTVTISETFLVNVDVEYSLSSATDIMVQIYEHGGPLLDHVTDTLSGDRSKTYPLNVTAPSTPTPDWQLNVHLFYWDVDEWNQTAIESIYIDVISEPQIAIYTDKTVYAPGDTMYLGLDVTNPDGAMNVCFAIWVVRPDDSIYLYLHLYDTIMPANFSYSNPSFRAITLPNLPSGTYTWHAAFLKRATHTIIVEDTAEWAFS